MKVRSMVGLIPLFAVETLDSELIDSCRGFKHRMQWFIENRPDFSAAHRNAIARPEACVGFCRSSIATG